MIRHLQTPRADRDPRLPALFAQIRTAFGSLAEPLSVHASDPDLLAGAWAALYETVVVPGHLPRATKESIAVAVSEANRCPYCVDAHSVLLYALDAHGDARSIRQGGMPADARNASFVGWARATRRQREASTTPPPFTPEERAEAVGTALCFHYINRVVQPLLGDSPVPGALRFAKELVMRLVTGPFREALGRPQPAGASLPFLGPSNALPHLGWAAAKPNVLHAFEGLAAAVERGGARCLTPETRARLRDHLEAWEGDDPPLGSGWLDGAAGGGEDGRAARLALLAARAANRITEEEVAAFRRRWPGDAELVGVLAWGSFAAAERISSWLWVPEVGAAVGSRQGD